MRNALKNQTINILEMGIEEKKQLENTLREKATTATAAASCDAVTQEISLIWSFERFAVQYEYMEVSHAIRSAAFREHKILNY